MWKGNKLICNSCGQEIFNEQYLLISKEVKLKKNESSLIYRNGRKPTEHYHYPNCRR